MLCKLIKTNIFKKSTEVQKKTLKYLDLQFEKYCSIQLLHYVDEERPSENMMCFRWLRQSGHDGNSNLQVYNAYIGGGAQRAPLGVQILCSRACESYTLSFLCMKWGQ